MPHHLMHHPRSVTIFVSLEIKIQSIKIQSNLCTTTTLETLTFFRGSVYYKILIWPLKRWPLQSCGHCTQMAISSGLNVLTTTCEQRPAVNNSHFESSTTSINLSFIRYLRQTATFFRSQVWPLYTDLTVHSLGKKDLQTLIKKNTVGHLNKVQILWKQLIVIIVNFIIL